MSWLDTTISAVSPGWAARRAQARLAATAADVRAKMVAQVGRDGIGGHYLEAARRDRTSADWPSTAVSADGGIVPDLFLTNARARAAVPNDWAGRSIVGTYRRHVVGIGITPRSAARDPDTGKESPVYRAFNQRIDMLHDWWAHRPWLCDYENTKNLCEIDGLAVSEFATVGQAFCVHSFQPRRGMVGMKIQMFEVEQLDWTLTVNADNGNEIRNGIEVDGGGVAVAFWVFTGGHPLDGGFWRGTGRGGATSTRISADRVYHVIRQERVRQTHGLSQLAAVLDDIYQLKGYKQAEAVGKRLDACVGLKARYEEWYNPDGNSGLGGLGANAPAGGATADGRSNPKVRFEPGMIVDPGYGRYFESHASTRPGAQYKDYVGRQSDQIAAGAGADSAHMTRNFNEGTYTSQRQGALEMDREMDPIQANLIIDQWARPRREAFKLYAVLQGLVEAPGMFEDDFQVMAYLSEDWAGPPKPWVDPRNQAQATETALKLGLTDLRREKNILGGDWREAIHQRSTEQDLCDEEGVSLSWLSAPGASAATAVAGDPDDNGDAGGDEQGDPMDSAASERSKRSEDENA